MVVASLHGQGGQVLGVLSRGQLTKFTALQVRLKGSDAAGGDGAAERHHAVFTAVMALLKTAHRFRGVGKQRLPFPQNWASIGVGAAGQLQQALQCFLLGLILALGQLLEHHLALHVEIAAIEAGSKDQIDQQVTGLE